MWRWAFGAAVVAQFVALYQPNPPSVETGLPLDKLVHLVLFAVVGLLGVLAGVPVRWLMLGLLAQAALSELVQNLLPGRGGDVWDFAADLLGAGVGIALGGRLERSD